MFWLNLISNIRILLTYLEASCRHQTKSSLVVTCSLYHFSPKMLKEMWGGRGWGEAKDRHLERQQFCSFSLLGNCIAVDSSVKSHIGWLPTGQNPNWPVTAQMTCDFTWTWALRGVMAGASSACSCLHRGCPVTHSLRMRSFPTSRVNCTALLLKVFHIVRDSKSKVLRLEFWLVSPTFTHVRSPHGHSCRESGLLLLCCADTHTHHRRTHTLLSTLRWRRWASP